MSQAQLYDHVDLRVSNLAKVRALYDALMTAMGFTRLRFGDDWVNYYRAEGQPSTPFFGLMVDPSHRANGTRIAFRADSVEDVDRLAKVAQDAGAGAFEPPEDYVSTPRYYATFFEDADGNRLEISYTED